VSLFQKKSPRIRNQTLQEVSFQRQLLKGFLRLISIGVVVTLIYYATRLNAVTITEVTIVGGETISHDEVRARVTDELKGAYFLIVPKQFAFLYPHNRIVEVLEKIPRVYDIKVSRASRTVLDVSFDEYIPHALWCVAGNADVPCYFVTSDGYAFAPAPDLVGGTLTRHSIEGALSITEGVVIEAEQLHAIDTFIARAQEESNFRITSLIHKENNDVEFMINGGGMIYATLSTDLESTFENLKSVLASEEFRHIKPGNFKYIDVRFDNKVFVNESLETTDTATTTEVLSLPE